MSDSFEFDIWSVLFRGLTSATLSAELETYKGQSTVVSQRTLTGFLSKKGGKTGTKGWDKRWFDLSDGELKYFKDKEKKANGVIPVSQMVDIRPTISGTLGGKHAHRFELDTPDRTYYFSADTVSPRLLSPPPPPPMGMGSVSSFSVSVCAGRPLTLVTTTLEGGGDD